MDGAGLHVSFEGVLWLRQHADPTSPSPWDYCCQAGHLLQQVLSAHLNWGIVFISISSFWFCKPALEGLKPSSSLRYQPFSLSRDLVVPELMAEVKFPLGLQVTFHLPVAAKMGELE